MRVLIGVILALSVSFACDQPYEEVIGYKIGCPFVVTKDYVESLVDPDNNMSEYRKIVKGSFYEEIEIVIWNGIIEMVKFGEPYIERTDYKYSKNVDEAVLALNKRWGNYSEIKISERHREYSFYIWYPKNNVIGLIDVIVKDPYLKEGDDTPLALKFGRPKFLYMSKKLLDFFQENK